MPIHSITPAAMRFIATNPKSGLIPRRNAADPPAVPMSASECPANDCPRITVNVPTMPEHHRNDPTHDERRLRPERS